MFDAKDKSPEDDQPIVIEDDVWIGYRAIVLKGVTVGRGSVVGAGSVVTRDVPRYAIVAGVPARKVGVRFSEDEIREHERVLGLDCGVPEQ
jgi:acetyltransferase-like isoleucine patch superfamily enzyme